MKFGLLFGMRNPEQWRKPYQQVYEETLEQIRIAESLGFDSVWMSEHHSAEDGYCPSTLETVSYTHLTLPTNREV